DGGLLVAEEGTGRRDDSAGVSLITPAGDVGRLVSGFPSSRDSGDLAGANLVSVAPDGSKAYIGNFGATHLWTLPLDDSSGELPAAPLTPDDLGQAMTRLNNVMVINPFDLAYAPDGTPVVTDSSGNGVAIENADGTTRFFHRFDRLADPANPSVTVEAVPTGMARVGDEYLVTLTGGCPFPAGAGQLVVIDMQRNQRTIADGLNMPIDVAVGPDGALWLLEFATFTPDASCFTGEGYQVNSGRLSRLAPGCFVDGALRDACRFEPVVENLNFPGAVLPMPDGSLYVSEVFPGRVVRIRFGAPAASAPSEPAPAAESVTRLAPDPTAYDDLLQAVIATQQLRANPGRDLAEGDTPRAELGRLLFFDPILSGDRNISCATCHHPSFAMADGRVLPIGTGGTGLGPARVFVDSVALAAEAGTVRRLAGTSDAAGETIVHNPFIGQFVPRNSPTILNSALLPLQFWDGRVQAYSQSVKTLESFVNAMAMDDPLAAQALFPVTSLHEMAGATLGGLAPQEIRRTLIERLQDEPAYVDLFRRAFDDAAVTPADAAVTPTDPAVSPTDSAISPTAVVTTQRLVEALAAFERRLIYTDAPWDGYLAGDGTALTEQQKRGALLFFGALDPRINCAACHGGDNFTDNAFHNLLAPQLGPGKGNGYSRREDWGRANVTFDARDRFAFRTPSLRNATLTAPYFHDGAYATLEAAIHHHADIAGSVAAYDPSANGIPPDLYSSLQAYAPERQLASAAPL
ncbi:MAG TPA: ScyD/ScyE family protein, partial [Caldilinea sp.]|nr:ScyD/ScyE family protein [Caldilinea sp.]